MALSSLFIRLAVVIVPGLASNSMRGMVAEANGHLRSNRVNSGSWSQAVAQSKTQIGLPFWRRLRKELEAKKKDLASADTRESSLLSTGTRRDLLWQAVREVDGKFRNKFMCALEGGTTYAKGAMFWLGHAAYSKINIASPRECALMCAADSMADPSHKNLACKSFAYNKTAQECKFFNFAHAERDQRVQDACCTTGPPCNLQSMREEIRTHFQVELKRTILKVPSEHVVRKVALKSGESQWPYPQPMMVPMPQVQQPMSPYMQPMLQPQQQPMIPMIPQPQQPMIPMQPMPQVQPMQQPYMQPMPQPMVPMQPMPQVQPMQQPYMQPMPQPMVPMQPMPQVQPMQQPYMQPLPRAQPVVPAYKAPAVLPPRYPKAPMAQHTGHVAPVAKPNAALKNNQLHGAAWWFLLMVFAIAIGFAAAMGISGCSMNSMNKGREVPRGVSRHNSARS